MLVQAGAGTGSGVIDDEVDGHLTCPPVGEAQGLGVVSLDEALAAR